MMRTRIAARRALALRPLPEELEPKTLLSGYTPTPIEELYLQELDDARFNPGAFGASQGLNLWNVAPAQPLAMNPDLVESARLHSQDMIANNYFGHISPAGLDPGQRMAAAGLPVQQWAESIENNTNWTANATPFPASYAAQNTVESLSGLIVDQGVPSLDHRIMLLDIGGADHALRQIGIGIASQDVADPSGPYTGLTTDYTIDLGSTTNGNSFLTGVVFDDATGNGEYEPGEGLGGVAIMVLNAGSTVTDTSGGYSLQLAPGTYTVVASGGGLPLPIVRTVVVGNDNVQLNFDEDPNGASFGVPLGSSAELTLGSFTAFQANDPASAYSARIAWGNGTASTATITPNGQGGSVVTGSVLYQAAGTYAIRALVTDLSTGQTIALNATAYAGEAVPPGQSQGSSGSGQAAAGSGSQLTVSKVKKHVVVKAKPKPKKHAKAKSVSKKAR
jgi:hypothetical protein